MFGLWLHLWGCMRATMLRSRWKEPIWTSVSHTQIGQSLSSIDLNRPESCATCSTRFSRSRCILSHLAEFEFLANPCNIEVIIASQLLQDTAVFDLFSGMQSVSMGFSLALNKWIREKHGVSVFGSCMIGLSGGEGMKASLPELSRWLSNYHGGLLLFQVYQVMFGQRNLWRCWWHNYSAGSLVLMETHK